MSQKTVLPAEHSGFYREVFYLLQRHFDGERWRYSFTNGGTVKTGTIRATLGCWQSVAFDNSLINLS